VTKLVATPSADEALVRPLMVAAAPALQFPVLAHPGKPATWTVRLTSEFACPVTVAPETGHPFGGPGPHAQTSPPLKGRAGVPMSVTVPAGETPATAKRQIVSWDVRCRYAPAEAPWHSGECRRATFLSVTGER
jgi:hypothetical protein